MTNREIDAEVAGKVMGLGKTCLHCGGTLKTTFVRPWSHDTRPFIEDCIKCEKTGIRQEWPHYSTDIAAAWTVVEKFAEKGIKLSICPSPKGFNISIGRAEGDVVRYGIKGKCDAYATTAPLVSWVKHAY